MAGEASAGHPFQTVPSPGSAVRIFTGAVMPHGLDTVVMQEDACIEPKDETLGAYSARSEARRQPQACGEIRSWRCTVEAGARLRPQEIATAAATGLDRIRCYASLKVAIVSTGDEILRPGETLHPARSMTQMHRCLRGLVGAAGAEAVNLGILPDKAELVRAALLEASLKYDAVVISGGASQGAEDHVVKSIDALGKRHLWQIAIKPGRPMSFGQIGDCVVLGLPGNPVAVFVCFLIYVSPMLTRLAGGAWPEPARFPLPASFTVKKKVGRREFWRARLERTGGRLAIAKFARDGSG